MAVADAAGWLGALILVAAYAATTGGPSRRPVAVHTANIVGSLGLGAVAAAHRAWPSVVVNVVWLVIAGQALGLELATRRRMSSRSFVAWENVSSSEGSAGRGRA